MARPRSLQSLVALLAISTCVATEDQSGDVAQMDESVFEPLGPPREFEDLPGGSCNAQYTAARTAADNCLKNAHNTLDAMNYGAEQTTTHENVTQTIEMVSNLVCQCESTYKSLVTDCMSGENSAAVVAIEEDITVLQAHCTGNKLAYFFLKYGPAAFVVLTLGVCCCCICCCFLLFSCVSSLCCGGKEKKDEAKPLRGHKMRGVSLEEGEGDSTDSDS
mmetsp:Transcript_36989/g.109844  ORF Transcript_36989/g.109844 Transcript_36989/m.109844 type:complete len:219 (-) Transcript_36989:48-704(-)